MQVNLKQKPWWDYLEHDLRELLNESLLLLKRVHRWHERFHDYSFVVFPAAKAYEGFLKKLFLDLGFISQEDYFGQRFRIGKALNPTLDREKYKDQSVYDKVAEYCKGQELADLLWDTWKRCRNLIFHWFPEEKRAIDFEEAKQRVTMVMGTIDEAFRSCKIKIENKK